MEAMIRQRTMSGSNMHGSRLYTLKRTIVVIEACATSLIPRLQLLASRPAGYLPERCRIFDQYHKSIAPLIRLSSTEIC